MGRSRSRSPPARTYHGGSSSSHSGARRGYGDRGESDRRDRGGTYDRERGGHRERDQDRGRDYDRSRQRRSRSRDRRGSSPGSPPRKRNFDERKPITEADLAGKTEDEIKMLKVMGFCNFDTTKEIQVKGNAKGDVHVVLKRKYRQYMNRKGGFNRPLDFVT